MTNKKLILNNILNGVKMISNPVEGFSAYKYNKMYNFYRNFLEHTLVYLFDDCQIEELIKEKLPKWGLKRDTLHKLQTFLNHIEEFSERHDQSDDYILLRDNYWDEFVKEAKECVRLLERDLAHIKEAEIFENSKKKNNL